MFLAYVLLSFWLCKITAGTFYDKRKQGITDITSYTIPANATGVTFGENKIIHIPALFFQNLPNLTHIYLPSNRISKIDDHAFAHVLKVTFINLGHNKLEVIHKHMFSGVPNLQTLYLDANSIHSIESGSFNGNTAVSTLFLHTNLLQTLNESIFDLENPPSKLNRFNMFGNPLSCECLGWLKHADGTWITVLEPSETVCSGQGHLQNRTWASLILEEFNCHSDITTDQKFVSSTPEGPECDILGPAKEPHFLERKIKIVKCNDGIQTIVTRYINATLDGLNMTPLIFMDNDDQTLNNPTIKKFRSNNPEQECIIKCIEMERCHAIQAVYGNEEIDEIGLMKFVKWCAFLEIDQAKITRINPLCNKNYRTSTAFAYIESFLSETESYDLENDYRGYWISVIMKST